MRERRKEILTSIFRMKRIAAEVWFRQDQGIGTGSEGSYPEYPVHPC